MSLSLEKHKHIAAFLVYVDDFLAAGLRDFLQPLLNRLLHVWKGSNPDVLGREPGDVDAVHFLDWTLSWVLRRDCLYINSATSMPFFKRGLIQNASEIDAFQESLNHSLSESIKQHELAHAQKAHVSIRHSKQDKIHLNIPLFCV